MDNIEKALVLSTAHISESTRQKFDRNEKMPFRYEHHEYGWILFATTTYEDELDRWSEIPDLLAIMKLANKNHCTLINLDADADEAEGLETFEWA
jgi:hypothetical protein